MRLFLGEINLFCLRAEADTIATKRLILFEYEISRVENIEEISHGSNLLTNSNLVL